MKAQVVVISLARFSFSLALANGEITGMISTHMMHYKRYLGIFCLQSKWLDFGLEKGISSMNTARERALNEMTKRMPALHFNPPQPVRAEFTRKEALSTADLENIDIGIGLHRHPIDLSDKVAYLTVKFSRVFADAFFRKRYIHRAIVLETIAAVPGMVAGMIRHLNSLRKMKHDGGWIHQLLNEAENERMHLMTWMKITQPSLLERLLITIAQGVFFNAFFIFYLLSPRTAHRMVGYLEEEAVISYTCFLNEILSGRVKDEKAPQIAIDYWHLSPDATLKDVVLAVRADEANHRDVNHHFSDRILIKNENLRNEIRHNTTNQDSIQDHRIVEKATKKENAPS